MRKIIRIFLAILTLPLSGFMLPHPSSDESRVPGSVYICSEPNWTGSCSSVFPGIDVCLDFSPGDWGVESFGPDAGAECILFR